MFISHANILFILGILGLLFYIASPILFPHVANIRQPELLPVYSLMIGLGQLLRTGRHEKEPPESGSTLQPAGSDEVSPTHATKTTEVV